MIKHQLLPAIGVEALKLRRSRLFWISLAACLVLPVMLALIFSGLTGTTENIAGTLDVPGFIDELKSVVSIGGLIGFGFIFSWIFGREYSDRTVKDLLALPLSRYGVAAAKLIVAVAWCEILAVLMYIAGGTAARLVRMDGWSMESITQGFRGYAMLYLMVILLCIPVAWVASVGRGYLSALGFIVLTVVISQLGSGMGIIEYIPWAIPGLLSGASGEANSHLQLISLLLPVITGAIGAIGTLSWWRYADHT
jgi:ABC-2 type transport system permease protein